MHAGRVAGLLVAVSTMVVIVSASIVPFLTPAWVSFEQGRADALGWTGFSPTDLRAATDSILSDLVIGPPAFDVAVGGQAVLDERERGHMRDVRTVFIGLWALTVAALVILVAAAVRWRDRVRLWLAVRRGAGILAVVVVALGIVAAVAFDTLFEVFHEVLFPAGSYDFDPRTERLVQLFPFTFWQETALVVGAVIVVGSVVVWAAAGRRRAR